MLGEGHDRRRGAAGRCRGRADRRTGRAEAREHAVDWDKNGTYPQNSVSGDISLLAFEWARLA